MLALHDALPIYQVRVFFYSGRSKMLLKRRGRNIEHRHSALARGWPNRESEMAAEAPIYTLGALLRSSAASHADSPALIFPDRKVSYRQPNESARACARTFLALGIKPGDNVAILLTTLPAFVALLFGLAMAGGVAVPVTLR